MRIVHLTQLTKAEITGGQAHHIAYLTAALERLGHEVIVVNTTAELTPTTGNGRYVPNGVDTTIFFPCSRPKRERLKIKHRCAGKRVFLCARRWAPTKGIIYLAKALLRLSPAARASSTFLFAGNETPGYDRHQKNIREQLAASGCEVRLLGNLGHAALAEVMNVSNVCILPSLVEATSLACLEAMACATPVLATRTGGLIELVRHRENGWLVPPRDERALAAQIESVSCAEPDALRSLGQNVRKFVERNYTWENTALETEKIYQEALQRRR